MPFQRHLIGEIDLLNTLKLITQAYQQISVTYMQKIRGSVLSTREFSTMLRAVFFEVKSSYRKEIQALQRKKKIHTLTQLSTLSKNKKTISVFVAAHTKLYGDIILKVFKIFVEYVKNGNSDIMIIGRLGQELYEHYGVKKPYTYFEIPDINLKMVDLRPIMYHLIKYQTINVFYGKFENIMVQQPTMTNITGDQLLAKYEISQVERQYLFEPSLEQVLNFFETQIVTSLLKQSVHESELAKAAARIKAMEEAQHNIESRSKKLFIQKRKMQQSDDNKRQIHMIAGMSLWRYSR